MRKTIVGVALALAALVAWALPTLEQVQDEVRQGHLSNAEQMMREVVTERPGSARAHYVYAEVLARNGKFTEAAEQARLARQADPQITFTDPAKFTAFEQLLAREGRAASGRSTGATTAPAMPTPREATRESRPAAAASSGLPGWIWIALIAVVGVMLWRRFSRSRAAAAGTGLGAGGATAQPGAMPPGYGPQGPNGPYGPGSYGPGGYGAPGAPGARSGMLGTGVAAAGGFAAGMLADRLMHGQHQGGTSGGLDQLGPTGLGTGMSDPAAMELESRPVDFGTGGSDWGGDVGSADAGSFDVGSGGGDDWS